MNASSSAVESPAHSAAPSGTPLKWLWGAIGVLTAAALGLGGTLLVQQHKAVSEAPPAAQESLAAAHTPEAEIIEEKRPVAQVNRAQEAPESVANPARVAPVRTAQHRPATPAATQAPRHADAAPPQPVQARAPVCAVCGRIESVQPVQKAAPATGVGAVAGGVLGAVVGNQVGHGTGRAAATLLGAAGGGYLGHTIEQRTRTQTMYEVRVRMEDGAVRQFQRAQPVPVGAPVVLEGRGFRLVNGEPAAETAPEPPYQQVNQPGMPN